MTARYAHCALQPCGADLRHSSGVPMHQCTWSVPVSAHRATLHRPSGYWGISHKHRTKHCRSARSAVAPRPAVSCSEVPSSQNGTCRKTVDPSSPSSSLTTTLHKSWQGQLRRCVPVGAHRHVQLWHVRWSLAVCTYTGVRVLSAVSAKPATVSPFE